MAERPPAESLNVRILGQRPALQAWNLMCRGGAHDPGCKTMTDYPLPSCCPPFKKLQCLRPGCLDRFGAGIPQNGIA
jgi:hypothetical protein